MLEDCFLEGLELVLTPFLIADVFIENDHRPGDDLFRKLLQNSFRRAIDIAINIHETDGGFVFFNETWKGVFEPAFVKSDIFRHGWNDALRAVRAFGLVMLVA